MRWAFLQLGLCAAACTGAPSRGADAGADAEADAAPAFVVSGFVEDDDARPLPRAGVLVCNTVVCHSGESGITGALTVGVRPAGDYLLHVIAGSAYGASFADLVFPLRVDGDVDLGALVPPRVGRAVPLDPQAGGQLVLDSDIHLDIDAGVSQLPPLAQQAAIAGVLLAPDRVPARLSATGPPRKPLGALVLTPWLMRFSAPVAFAVPFSAPAQTVELFHADYTTGKLARHSGARVDAAGRLRNTPGEGLRAFGWFVIYPAP